MTWKIARAIFRAATSVGGKDYQTAYRLALQVQQRLEEKYPPSHLPIEDSGHGGKGID